MGRHHYSSAHWQDVSSSLRKMTQWERRSSLISSPEVYASNQHVATSLLAVVTIWWIMRGRKKQNFSFKSSIPNRPFYCCIKTAIDICKPISFSLLLGFFLISLISSGVLQHSRAISSWHEYNTGHISILPKFIVNLLQVWRNGHMGCLEYYSLLGLAHCCGHLILLLLLCGDVEVNPGPYEEEKNGKYMQAYHEMVSSEENVIDILIAKVIFLGPPGRGKTVTRRRLFGEIVNISTEEGEQPSAGVIDAHTFVVKKEDRTTGLLNPGDDWISITTLKDEKQLLCKLFHWASSGENNSKKADLSTPKVADHEKDSKKTSTSPQIDTTSNDNVHTVGADRETMNELPESSQDSELVHDTGDQPELKNTFQTAASDSLVDPNSPFKAMDSDTLTEKDHVKDSMKTSASPDSEDNIDLPDSFQESCIVYMQDTGGQPELMDMLPALTIGPALYLLFCRLNDKLNEPFEVIYTDPSVADKGGKSQLCLSDYILTFFSSIFYVHQAEQNREQEEYSSMEKEKKSSKNSAYIIGTYKDEVREDEIQKFDQELKEIVMKTELFREGVMNFKSPNKDELVYPIDNKFGNVDEILKLQQFLENALRKNFKKVKIPACWLAFNLSLRSRGAKTISLKDCILYGEKCHMSEENTKLALWFFHHHAGILMYFPEVKDLEDIVIVDTQVIYDCISRVILLAHSKLGGIYQYQAEGRNGKLTFELLEKACEKENSITPQQFLALLKHFKVLAPISKPWSSSSSTNVNEMYFMPCILNSVSNQDLDNFKNKHSCPIVSSLRLFYASGFVPIGIFSALIARLAGESKVEERKFKLVENDVKKNRVQFLYGTYDDIITIMSRPSFYEVFITIQHESEGRLHIICNEVKNLIFKIIKEVSPPNLRSIFASPQFAFECPDHGEHLCIVDPNHEQPKMLRCQSIRGHSKMQSQHLVWFGEPFKVQEPSKAPSNIVALLHSKYSATVTWNPPPKSSWNGFIRKYEVKVEDVSYDAPAKSSCNEKYEVEVHGVSHDKMEYSISNLSPDTEYSVQVKACTSAGPGKWSDPYKFTTHKSEELPYYSSKEQKDLLAKHLPTPKIPNINYVPYNKEIEFILSVSNDSEYEAAVTYIGRPSIEDSMTKSDVATILEPNSVNSVVVVGKFAGAPVALVKTRGGSQIKEDLERELKHFENAKYILCIGTGCGFQKAKIEFGDVFISSKLTVVKSITKDYSGVEMEEETIKIYKVLHSIFCSTSITISDCGVSKHRRAKYFVDNVISGVNSVELYNKVSSPAIGGDMEGKELVHLKNIIVIKSVTGYIDGSRKDTWNFTGTMAALHYVKECLTPYIRTDRYVNAYNQMIASEKNIIKMLIAKVIFLGPPGRGKTVTRRRLFGEIVNISMEEGEQPSTGVIDAHTFVVKKEDRTTGLLNPGDNWRSITKLKDEKQLLYKLCHWASSGENNSKKADSSTPKVADHEKDSKKTSTLPQIDTTSNDNVHTVGADRETMNELPESSQDSELVHDTGDQPELKNTFQTAASDSLVDPNSPSKAMDSDTLTEKNHVKDVKDSMKTSASPDSEDNIDIADAIDDKTMDKLPDSFQESCIVYMQDTGGQPELMDMLPALTIGPALYLLFCRLTDKLNEPFEVKYRDPSVADKGGKSQLCLSDYILTIFSSIFCVHQAEQKRKEENKEKKSSTTVTYIIGTYRDEVDEDKLKKFDEELQKIVEDTIFYKKDLIQYMSPKKIPKELVYPINNKTGTKDEIMNLQKFLVRILQEHFEKRDIPACWLAFNLSLRSQGKSIILLKDCYLIGKKCHMTEDDTKLALWFFHHYAGILMYLREVKELEDIVIVDTQVIYDSITRLILIVYKDGVSQYQAENFQKHGKLTFELLEKACCIKKENSVTPQEVLAPQEFLALLKHFNVIAPIPEPESSSSSPTNVKEMFFMPCILSSFSDQNLDDFRMKNSCSIISSLRICYESGFVPVGLFSALIAGLVGEKKATGNFELVEKDVKKNCVQFVYGTQWRDTITIMSRPSFYEVVINFQKDRSEDRLHILCYEVKEWIIKIIRKVTPPNLCCENTSPRYAFECPHHGEHLCIVPKDKNPKFFDCEANPGYSARMQSKHLVWFGEQFQVQKPEKAPQIVKCFGLSTTSVVIQWKPPRESTHNGNLIEYEVILKKPGDEVEPKIVKTTIEKTKNRETMEVQFDNLRWYTTYSVEVTARTSKGGGPMSAPEPVTTFLFDCKCINKCIYITGTILLVLLGVWICFYKANSITLSMNPDSFKNELMDHSRNSWVIPKNSKLNLFQDLQDIGNWEGLCTRLRVSEAVIDELRYATLQQSIKKERCLSAYINSGEARWDHVVRVVCSHPFNDIVLGKRIAVKHNVPEVVCEQSTKYY